MKRTALLSMMLMATAIFFGCSKNNYDNTNTTGPNAMKYVINGITDVKMDYDAEKVLPLSIVRTSGNQEKLTLSVSGLPGRTTASFDVASGIPDFASILTLTTNYTDGGTYDVKITGTTASGATSDYSMKLTINPEPPLGCAEKMFGSYSAKYEGSLSYTNQTVTAEATGVKNKVRFKGFRLFDITGDVDCDKHTINIPSQTTDNSVYLSGTGTYDDTHITLNIYIKDINGKELAYYVCYMIR
jgi:hypothetical protein